MSQYVLTGSDGIYNPHFGVRELARIRKTNDGRYFPQSPGMSPDEEPPSYDLLADCQRECEEGVTVRRVERKLDGEATGETWGWANI